MNSYKTGNDGKYYFLRLLKISTKCLHDGIKLTKNLLSLFNSY